MFSFLKKIILAPWWRMTWRGKGRCKENNYGLRNDNGLEYDIAVDTVRSGQILNICGRELVRLCNGLETLVGLR